MIYKIPPIANPNEGMPYVLWNGAFSEDEVELIKKIGDSLPLHDASVVDGIDKTIINNNTRTSKASWIQNDLTTEWLYKKIAMYLRRINGEFYRFDVDGMYESMQYTVYESENQGFYNWHTDIGVYSSDSVTRKLSMSLLLTDPTSFEGGDLEIWSSSGPLQAPKTLGTMVVFPSYALHRVTPVTKGTRRSLVVWFGGPAFK